MPIRKASKAPFPYGPPGTDRVLYFYITNECLPEQLRTASELESALHLSRAIYAAWPGSTRTDLFLIDEPNLLLEAIAWNDTNTTRS